MSRVDNLLKKFPVMELFGPTIQGEGVSIGQQTYFIRFGGCDYRCHSCDSLHAVYPDLVKENAKRLTAGEILKELTYLQLQYPDSTNWITFTGGNPLMHDLELLVRNLKDFQWKINVETQGSIFRPWLRHVDQITVSPKGPGMVAEFDAEGFDNFMRQLHAMALLPKTTLKFVIFGKDDIDFAAKICNDWNVPPHMVFLSQGNPFWSDPNIHQDRLMVLLKDKYLELFDLLKTYKGLSQVKFLPQFHVWLWGNRQGV